MKAGTVWINTYNIAPAELPWGGYYKVCLYCFVAVCRVVIF